MWRIGQGDSNPTTNIATRHKGQQTIYKNKEVSELYVKIVI